MARSMPVLITGGSGFVGLNIAAALLAANAHVVLYGPDRPPAATERYLHGLSGSLAIEIGDVRDGARLVQAIRGHQVTSLVHGAAITAGLERETHQARLIADVNLGGTIEVLEAALACGITRVVQLGTGAVHGAVDPAVVLIDEGLPALPVSLYGITKYAAERTALRYRDSRGLDVVVARLGVVFGRWEYDTGVRDSLSLPLQLQKMAEAGEVARFRAGLPEDWVYATDIANAVVALLRAVSLRHGVYQIATGGRWSIAAWCDRLKQVFPAFDYLITDDETVLNVGITSPAGRPPFAVSRLQQDTGFSARFGAAESFDDYIRWRREQASTDVDA
jgi:nucleoside-diphosphate-sugar epimerase